MKCYDCREDKNVWTELHVLTIRSMGEKIKILICLPCISKREEKGE